MIPLLQPCITENGYKYVKDCLSSGWISYAGNYVSDLEKEIEDIVGQNKKAVALNSGTSGLFLALKLLGIGEGDYVIVPTMTFIATVNAIMHTGAKPVFIDCNDSLCMDPELLERCMSLPEADRIKAIMPVHVLGSICDMDKIMEFATKNSLRVVEDAAQALGSDLRGQHAGTFGDIGVFSFSFNKMITAGGGGMIIANKYLADRAKYLALQAKDDQTMYIHNDVGYNLGMGNISAALALSQVESIGTFRAKKRAIWKMYKEATEDIDSVDMVDGLGDSNRWLSAIRIRKHMNSSYNIPHVIELMKGEGIQTRPMFKPNHIQQPYWDFSFVGSDRAEQAYSETLCLPSSVDLTEADQLRVIEMFRRF